MLKKTFSKGNTIYIYLLFIYYLFIYIHLLKYYIIYIYIKKIKTINGNINFVLFYYVINKETSEEKEEKICSSCDKVIKGQFVRALGGIYHLDCFRCVVCSQL